MKNDGEQNKDGESKGNKLLGSIKIALAIIPAIAVVIAAIIDVSPQILNFLKDYQEERKKEQDAIEQKQAEEEIEVKDRNWEIRAGIEYFRCSLGTASKEVHFQIRPYLFCDVTLNTGEVIHCWIRNHYTQKVYMSEDGRVELLSENNRDVLKERLKHLLESEKYTVVEIEIYSLLLVKYSVYEESPEYVCYYLENDSLQKKDIEWGYELINCKENQFLDAESKIWRWIK